jgi:7-carboxy-7-deazaguanine synthase
MLITEIFHSIQGEGPLTGIPMYFVRTNRCNLRCTWCDSTYTFQGGSEMPLKDLLMKCRKTWEQWICFTGGEPMIQREALDFMSGLPEKNILLETGGSISLENVVTLENVTIDMDIKTPSSGEEKSLYIRNLSFLRKTDYVKFVIKDGIDYDYAKNFLFHNHLECGIVFQPAWGAEFSWIPESIIKDGLNVRFMLQSHKFIWGEERER